MANRYRTIFVLLFVLIGGCAGFGAGREPPVVNLQSFRTVPGDGGSVPAFEIGLVVLNPNPDPLRLRGISYSIRLDGRSLLDGVSNDLPVIEGYGQETITLVASVNVLGGIRLMTGLLRSRRDAIDYEFSARLDPSGFSRPIRVSEFGQIDLATPAR